MHDLERVLEDIRIDDLTHRKRLTRRFIVTEGIFSNHGDVTPLDRLVELKDKFKYRLILDESLSIGVVGKHGGGLTDLYNIKATKTE